MPPKFPGMNPYLENPELWSEVHFGLISVMARTLNAVITPRYRAAVEKRVYMDSLLVGIPDVAVSQRGPNSDTTDALPTTVTLSEPVAVTVPIVEETQERFLEIREVGTGTVVTVVEVLSPKNKRAGVGKEKYDTKRQRVLGSTAHLVEIDLLRTGESKQVAGGVTSDYRILISRPDCRPTAELYPFNLRDALPRFLLPLRSRTEEPVMNLQSILEQVCQEAALDLAIDSRKDRFHQIVRNALEKEDWIITHDPFMIQVSEAVKLKIDLGAENAIAAQRGQEKIAVEIKSFITDSDISEFHTALGQYLNYLQALEVEEPDRTLHLAVPLETYADFFQIPFIQTSLKRHAVNMIVYDPIKEEIKIWKSYSNIAK